MRTALQLGYVAAAQECGRTATMYHDIVQLAARECGHSRLVHACNVRSEVQYQYAFICIGPVCNHSSTGECHVYKGLLHQVM